MKDVIQKQVTANVETVFNMQLKRSQFFVKNFTTGNISVSLGNNETESIIGAKSWERVFNNVIDGTAVATNIVRVLPEQSGTVEVASIDW